MKIEDMTSDERRYMAYQAMVKAWDAEDFRYHNDLNMMQRLALKRRWCDIAAMFDHEMLSRSSLGGDQ